MGLKCPCKIRPWEDIASDTGVSSKKKIKRKMNNNEQIVKRRLPNNNVWVSRGFRSCWRTTCAARWLGAHARCAAPKRRIYRIGNRHRRLACRTPTSRCIGRRRRRRVAAIASGGWACRRCAADAVGCSAPRHRTYPFRCRVSDHWRTSSTWVRLARSWYPPTCRPGGPGRFLARGSNSTPPCLPAGAGCCSTFSASA